jgi:hypothetical protein
MPLKDPSGCLEEGGATVNALQQRLPRGERKNRHASIQSSGDHVSFPETVAQSRR